VEQTLCNGRVSVRPAAAATYGGFGAEQRAGKAYRSTAVDAGAQQHRRHSTAFSSKCGPLHADSRVDEAEHRLDVIRLPR